MNNAPQIKAVFANQKFERNNANENISDANAYLQSKIFLASLLARTNWD